MHSIGNDIVALDKVDHQRSSEQRFYSKIISEEEIRLYQQPGFGGPGAADTGFSVFVWICWCVKEAAYKFLKRIQPELSFSPIRFRIENIALTGKSEGFYFETGAEGNKTVYRGILSAHDYLLSYTVVTDNRLITAVVSRKEDPFFSAIHEITGDDYEDQSKSVRQYCLTEMSRLLPGKTLHIGKHIAGYPILMDQATALDMPVSFAHHGRFVSYAIALRH